MVGLANSHLRPVEFLTLGLNKGITMPDEPRLLNAKGCLDAANVNGKYFWTNFGK